MSDASESSDPRDADVAGQPRVVLDDDGLDTLELVLGGWLPASAIVAALGSPGPGMDVLATDGILTDAENTPLARVVRSADGSTRLEAKGKMARGLGPQWDPDVRLAAGAARARVRAGSGDELATLVCIVDEPPTRAATSAMLAMAAIPEVATVLVIAAARRGPTRGVVGPAGVTRSAWGLADALAAARPDLAIVRLVLPWPIGARFDLAQALGDLGATAVASASELKGPSRLDGIDDVEATYPPASAREILRARATDAHGAGAVVFFTGLSGSGKSTIARALADELADAGPRKVTLLDGDEVRQHLSRGLGFDAESRAINVDRIAWVASLVAAHGGIAVAAPIAPFDAGRKSARAMAERDGVFLLVWVSTPLAVCEARDRKGLYAKARAGEVAEFTGISSPYEPPEDADVVIDASEVEVPEAVRRIRVVLDAALAAQRTG